MISLSEADFHRMYVYIQKHYGIDLSKKKQLIVSRLSNTLAKMGYTDFTRYVDDLVSSRRPEMVTDMLNKLTTNYTYFMREPKHFDFLRENILSNLTPEWGRLSYQIWCAGCSSGEECYSLAMILQDYKDQGRWLPPFSIVGTDISEQALAVARNGRYPARELENVPVLWQQKYLAMDESGNSFEIGHAIREKVRFQHMNLLKPSVGLGQYDLVLCRNVMIYFNEESRKKLIDKLYRALKPGGYLFVGHTELLPRNHELFEYVCPAVYRK